MIRSVRFGLMLAMFAPALANAQLVSPSAPQNVSACADRPDEPVVIQNMDVREANRVLFLRDMYRAYTFNDIVETGTCDCSQRYPEWQPVVEYYFEHYAGIDDRHELRERARPYRDVIDSRRSQARDICLAAGTWK